MLDDAMRAALPVCKAPKTESVRNSTEVRLWIWSEIESWPSTAVVVAAGAERVGRGRDASRIRGGWVGGGFLSD